MTDSQQHADAKRSIKTQIIVGALIILIGSGATGLLGWIAFNTSENNATLKGLDQKLSGAVDQLRRVDGDVQENEKAVDKNRRKIRDNAEQIRRNQRDLKRLQGPHPRPWEKQEGRRQ